MDVKICYAYIVKVAVHYGQKKGLEKNDLYYTQIRYDPHPMISAPTEKFIEHSTIVLY